MVDRTPEEQSRLDLLSGKTVDAAGKRMLRIEALRATAQMMDRAMEIEGSTPRNTAEAAAEMAEYLTVWLETGNY